MAMLFGQVSMAQFGTPCSEEPNQSRCKCTAAQKNIADQVFKTLEEDDVTFQEFNRKIASGYYYIGSGFEGDAASHLANAIYLSPNASKYEFVREITGIQNWPEAFRKAGFYDSNSVCNIDGVSLSKTIMDHYVDPKSIELGRIANRSSEKAAPLVIFKSPRRLP